MRTDYRFVNSREVTELGYDPEKKICVIHYNHMRSGATIYYEGVEKEEFDRVSNSNCISSAADEFFKDKKQTPKQSK